MILSLNFKENEKENDLFFAWWVNNNQCELINTVFFFQAIRQEFAIPSSAAPSGNGKKSDDLSNKKQAEDSTASTASESVTAAAAATSTTNTATETAANAASSQETDR